MDNPRAEKVAVVDEVRERLTSSSAALLTEYRGMNVKQLAELRRALRPAGGDYKIYKNTLVRFAAHAEGITDIDGLLKGPTAIAFVDGDAAAVAKALRDFARTHPSLVLKGGVLGVKVLSADDLVALADLPPRDVLLAQLAGAFQAPIAQLAGLLQALPRNFAYGLKALIDSRGGPVAEEPPAAEATEPVAEATEPVAEATEPVETTETPEVTEPTEPAAAEEQTS
jgi:large subunit ribosomal protein L10